jgi:hypothetical protein
MVIQKNNKKGDNMNTKQKESLIIAWNEIEEVYQDIESLSGDELKHCQEDILVRLKTAMNNISSIVRDKDFTNFFKKNNII